MCLGDTVAGPPGHAEIDHELSEVPRLQMCFSRL